MPQTRQRIRPLTPHHPDRMSQVERVRFLQIRLSGRYLGI